MTWFDALLLGIVQGLTEFLPISSSAHLSIVGQLLGREDPGAAFTAITQLGTESAVLVYFRHEIVRILRAWTLALVGRGPRDDPDARMGWFVIVGTLPIGILGFAFQESIETFLRNLWITATMLILFAFLLAYADANRRHLHTLRELTWRHAILFGFAQALALIPGVSRSGGTITAGLLMGYTREAAARYSFLLAIPAVLASGLFQLLKISEDPVEPAWGPIALATGIAFGVGYGVIVAFLRYVSHHSYRPFVYYRFGLGFLVIVLLVTGALSASG